MQRNSSQAAVSMSAEGLTFGTIAQSETADVDEDVPGQQREPRIEEGYMALSEAGFVYSVKGRTAIGTAGGGYAVLK